MSQPLPWDTGVMNRRRSSTGSRRNSLLSVSLFDFPLTPGAQRDLVNAGCFPYDNSDPFAPLSLGDPLMSSSMALATSQLLASPRRPQRPSVTDRLLGDRSEGSIPTVISAGSNNNNSNNSSSSSNSNDLSLSNPNNNNNNQQLFGNNNNGMYNNNSNNNIQNNMGQMPLPGNPQASLNPMDQLHLQRHNSTITAINSGLSNDNNMMYNKQRMGSITGSTASDMAQSFNQQPAAAARSLMMGSSEGRQQQQPQVPIQFNKKVSAATATKKGKSTEDEDEDDDDDELNQHRFKPFHEEKWSLRYKELLEFHKHHGHAAVPHTYPANPQLARWVKRQRRQYKLRQDNRQSTMTSERLEMLDSIGFVWDSHDVNWREKLENLVGFRQEHGHCNVPSNYRNKKLATWVKCQRRQYKLYWDGKPSAMTPDRILELEKVGFEWEIRSTVPRKQAAAAKQKQQIKSQVVATTTPQTPTNIVKPTPQQQQDFQLLYQNLTDL